MCCFLEDPYIFFMQDPNSCILFIIFVKASRSLFLGIGRELKHRWNCKDIAKPALWHNEWEYVLKRRALLLDSKSHNGTWDLPWIFWIMYTEWKFITKVRKPAFLIEWISFPVLVFSQQHRTLGPKISNDGVQHILIVWLEQFSWAPYLQRMVGWRWMYVIFCRCSQLTW